MRLAIAISLFAAACGGQDRRPERTCGAQDFIYVDRSCSLLPGNQLGCSDQGDGLCYLRCGSDGDCPDGAPYCRTLGLYSGGDYSCNASVRICRDTDHDDCPLFGGRR